MSFETSKGMRRRKVEQQQGIFDWDKIFKGTGIDVGVGDDPIFMMPEDDYNNWRPAHPREGVVWFDLPSCKDTWPTRGPFVGGDANKLSTYFQPEQFDWLYASQCLEHMHSPDVFHDWLKIVKVGGYAVILVPSWELYEGKVWPSPKNHEHQITWSVTATKTPAPQHIHVPTWLNSISYIEPLLCRQLDYNYDYDIGVTEDQSLKNGQDGPHNNVEPWIEFVVRKTAPSP